MPGAVMSTNVSTRRACVLLMLITASPRAAGAFQDPEDRNRSALTEIKALYEAAEYDRALAAGDQAAPGPVAADEARDVEIYRTLCLLALGNKAEAGTRVEQVLQREPLYEPQADLPNRLRTLVAEVRNRIGPALAQAHYVSGKELFDAGDYGAASQEFALVVQLTDLLPPASQADRSDLHVLAAGFRDLSSRALASAKPAETSPPEAEGSAPPDLQIVPPVIIRQDLPQWPATPAARNEAQRLGTLSGVLEVVIAQTGTVDSAKLVKRIDPYYDALLLNAARRWKYQPATRNGVPIEYVKRLDITIR